MKRHSFLETLGTLALLIFCLTGLYTAIWAIGLILEAHLS